MEEGVLECLEGWVGVQKAETLLGSTMKALLRQCCEKGWPGAETYTVGSKPLGLNPDSATC